MGDDEIVSARADLEQELGRPQRRRVDAGQIGLESTHDALVTEPKP